MVIQIIYEWVALNWFLDYIADYICELSYATFTRINAVRNKVQFTFAAPVSGLIPDLKERWRLFPASELQLSLVSPQLTDS